MTLRDQRNQQITVGSQNAKAKIEHYLEHDRGFYEPFTLDAAEQRQANGAYIANVDPDNAHRDIVANLPPPKLQFPLELLSFDEKADYIVHEILQNYKRKKIGKLSRVVFSKEIFKASWWPQHLLRELLLKKNSKSRIIFHISKASHKNAYKNISSIFIFYIAIKIAQVCKYSMKMCFLEFT